MQEYIIEHKYGPYTDYWSLGQVKIILALIRRALNGNQLSFSL